MAAPTFGGITSATLNSGAKLGSVNVAWSAASGSPTPLKYRIYVRRGAAPDVFGADSSYYLCEVYGLQFDVYSQADGITRLQASQTYYFIIRAVNNDAEEETNTTPFTGQLN